MLSRFVGAGEANGKPAARQDVLDERRLAHLPRPCDDVDEAARFGEAASEDGGLWACEGHCGLYNLLNLLSIFTQYGEQTQAMGSPWTMLPLGVTTDRCRPKQTLAS